MKFRRASRICLWSSDLSRQCARSSKENAFASISAIIGTISRSPCQANADAIKTFKKPCMTARGASVSYVNALLCSQWMMQSGSRFEGQFAFSTTKNKFRDALRRGNRLGLQTTGAYLAKQEDFLTASSWLRLSRATSQYTGWLASTISLLSIEAARDCP